jgi:uncharacterized membrane protein
MDIFYVLYLCGIILNIIGTIVELIRLKSFAYIERKYCKRVINSDGEFEYFPKEVYKWQTVKFPASHWMFLLIMCFIPYVGYVLAYCMSLVEREEIEYNANDYYVKKTKLGVMRDKIIHYIAVIFDKPIKLLNYKI